MPASTYLNAFWQHAKMYPKQTSRYLYGIYTYKEKVDETRLRFALQQLVDNHPVLKTQFKSVHNKLHILLRANPNLLLTTYTVASCDEATALINQLVASTLDVTQDDLYQFHLIDHCDTHGSTFIVMFHHMMMDGSLFDYFMNKMNKHYEDYPRETKCEHHFENDLKDQLEHEQLSISQESIQFWNERLCSYPLSINMPFIKKSVPLEDQKTCTTQFYISTGLTKEISHFLQDSQVSIFNFLKILWATLIGHYAHQDQLIILHAVSVRAPQLKHLEGSYINILPYPLNLNISLYDELLNTAKMLNDLKSHRYLPMEKIIAEFLQTTTQTQFDNALKIVFAQTDLRIKGPQFAQKNVQALETPNLGSAYLLLEYQMIDEKIAFQLNYISPAISEADIMQMQIDFVNLLKKSIKNQKTKLSELQFKDLECHDFIPIESTTETHFFQNKGAKW